MGQQEVDRKRLELREDPALLSPPIVRAPLYGCATVVTVEAFVPGAKVEVEVNGASATTEQAGNPLPDGITIAMPAALAPNDVVRARQITAVAQSDWSAPATVSDHTVDFPAGPPRPQIDPAPPYACGDRTGVNNLLTGGNVWIATDGTEVGRVDGCRVHQGVDVTPDYGLGQRVRAWFEMCRDPSPPSIEYVTGPAPTPLPSVGFDAYYVGSGQLRLTNIANGARVTLYRGGASLGTSGCWGQALLWDVTPTVGSADVFSAVQSMCPGDPSSTPVDTTPLPCSSLPAPVVGPIQAGDDRITLTTFVLDAVIKVFRGGVQIGAGGGPVVMLTTTIASGDTIHVVQDLSDCQGQTAQEVTVGCVDPPVATNPSALDLFPVGHLDYSAGAAKGTVYYPADDDGEGVAFNGRLASLGQVPIVFIAHGNHAVWRDPNNPTNEACGSQPSGWVASPNHKGYVFFQEQLARMGMVAVSIDCNATNCTGFSASNIEDRADLIITNIAHFQNPAGSPEALLNGHVDFARVGLMGHSRGGEAVVLVPEVIGLAGVTIAAVLALDPTDAGASNGRPERYAFMTVLPAGNGDVAPNYGARFYDQARPDTFKTQLYVHHANHDWFNREWPEDDSLWSNVQPSPPVMSAGDHQGILSAYGCAFFRSALLGHATTRYLAGFQRPSGVLWQNVHLSFERAGERTVDNHEDGNTINFNSLGQPTVQTAGMSADEFAFTQGGGSFNGTFYGNSTGMVARAGRPGREFRSALDAPADLSDAEIWIRAAEVTDDAGVPAGATGFELGVEDVSGTIAWIDTDLVGSLPRPYERRSGTMKTMLKTFRFSPRCLEAKGFELREVVAIHLRCDRSDEQAIAFDDLQIVRV